MLQATWKRRYTTHQIGVAGRFRVDPGEAIPYAVEVDQPVRQAGGLSGRLAPSPPLGGWLVARFLAVPLLFPQEKSIVEAGPLWTFRAHRHYSSYWSCTAGGSLCRTKRRAGGIYARRVAGGDHHHRNSHRVVVAGGPSRPRGGAADAMRQQSQADRPLARTISRKAPTGGFRLVASDRAVTD